MSVFVSTLNQTAFLFGFIIIGFILAGRKILPEGSAAVLSKLENTVFIPALVMGTFIENFTIERISSAWQLLVISSVIALIAVPFAIFVSKAVTKDKYIQKIYTYGLSFSNFGFMGNAVVSSLFPDIFFEYLIFTLPLWILIYLWGVPRLLIADSGNCMSPVAMILTGIVVSSISLKKTFTNVRIYIISIVRLIIMPLVFVWVASFFNIPQSIYICALCSLAMPLGLNTIVIPSALGKDTTIAAGMAIISHLLSCITIPLIFSIVL